MRAAVTSAVAKHEKLHTLYWTLAHTPAAPPLDVRTNANPHEREPIELERLWRRRRRKKQTNRRRGDVTPDKMSTRCCG